MFIVVILKNIKSTRKTKIICSPICPAIITPISLMHSLKSTASFSVSLNSWPWQSWDDNRIHDFVFCFFHPTLYYNYFLRQINMFKTSFKMIL